MYSPHIKTDISTMVLWNHFRPDPGGGDEFQVGHRTGSTEGDRAEGTLAAPRDGDGGFRIV